MSKANIKDLLSKPKILITEKGEIPIHKLTIGKKLELVSLIEKKETNKAAFEIVMYTLKRAFPDASEQDLNDLDDKILELVTKEAMEFNGLGGEEDPQSEPLKTRGQ